jgi:multidrug efflux system membrane fusion protein
MPLVRPLRRRFDSAAMLACALLLCGLSGCGKTSAGPAAPTGTKDGTKEPPPVPPVSVQFEKPIVRGVTPTEEFGGRAASKELIELRARVSGYLKKVNFVDGADVKAGDVLFEIEDETYKADHAEAEATVKQRIADVGRMRTQLERTKRLAQNQATTEQEVERLGFETAAAEAAQASAEAARDRLALDVKFTKVLAPISGRISRRLVDPGNLVQADTTPLANIVSIDPIYAYFDYDERSVLAMQRTSEKHPGAELAERSPDVLVSLAGEDIYGLTGKLNWIDNQIDMGTGTLRARALLDNKSGLITPGMFVRLRVPLGPEEQSILIPQEALISDQGNRYVYVLKGEKNIEYRKVVLGPITVVPVEIEVIKPPKPDSAETNAAAPIKPTSNAPKDAPQPEPETVLETRMLPWQVVREGLKPGERVVVTGLQRLKGNSEVTSKRKLYDFNDTTTPPPLATVPKAPTVIPSNVPEAASTGK